MLLAMVALTAQAAPVDFTLPDLEGVPHKLSDYRGKWVVVNYWATWCPPCLEEIPDLLHFYEKHKDKDAVVLGVNFEDIPMEQLKDFVDSMEMTYLVLREEPGPRSTLGVILGLPTTFVIDPEGNLAARNVGPLTGEAIETFMVGYKPAREPSSE
jgi:thiol-disulfide isomerase/thioredoxin